MLNAAVFSPVKQKFQAKSCMTYLSVRAWTANNTTLALLDKRENVLHFGYRGKGFFFFDSYYCLRDVES
jgi:hypothetical protein